MTWHLAMHGIYGDGTRGPVVPHQAPRDLPSLAPTGFTLSYTVADSPALRGAAFEATDDLLRCVHAACRRRDGDPLDCWSLESWTPTTKAKYPWSYLAVPVLRIAPTTSVAQHIPGKTPDEASRFEIDVLHGTAQPARDPWPDDAPPVVIDKEGPRAAPIQPGLCFTLDLTSLAPPAR
ncbi:hypothetical protein OG564_10805 [Streptomyces sp. NBC_01280]|uniref:hypothetical protein n=1 Tax=Streptomyces sp. NBC_01280 TaxID=2903810 RepID=UPI002E2EA560|nr:hypothetical protein [Streptomyces sp. NBC_01280]